MKMIKSMVRRILPKTLLNRFRWLRSRLTQDTFFHERAHRQEFMRKSFFALSFNGITGDYVEFGCCGGMTFSLAYHESRKIGANRKLWAFDSFAGLPPQIVVEDKHPLWQEGTMKMSLMEFQATCRVNRIPDAEYRIIAGFYEETIGKNVQSPDSLPVDIALAYIDCDLYSSTRIVLHFLAERLKHGMIIAFDDYYCYSNSAMSGERKACTEFLRNEERFHFLPYCQFGWHGMSFIVEDKAS